MSLTPTARGWLSRINPVDALLAGVVGRAYRCGKAVAPTGDERTIALVEGWIWLPSCGLAELSSLE